MIIDEIKKIKSSKKELKKFGVLLCIVFGIWGGIFLWRGKSYYSYFFITSVIFLSTGLVFPLLLWPIHKIWMSIALVWGWLIGKVILVVLFYGVFTPTGILLRLFGKRFLDLKFDKKAKTYWIKKDDENASKASYELQF